VVCPHRYNTIYTVPLVVDDTAYIGSTDKYLYVLDLERRVVKRKIYAASKIFSPPRLLEGRIYFGACNGIVLSLTPSQRKSPARISFRTRSLTRSPIIRCRDFYALTYVNQLSPSREYRLLNDPVVAFIAFLAQCAGAVQEAMHPRFANQYAVK